MRAAADGRQMRQTGVYGFGWRRCDAAGLCWARDGRNRPRRGAGENRDAGDVRTGLQAARRPAHCRAAMNFIEANGVSLRYAMEGSGKPIVLIHEMGGTMESWGLV